MFEPFTTRNGAGFTAGTTGRRSSAQSRVAGRKNAANPQLAGPPRYQSRNSFLSLIPRHRYPDIFLYYVCHSRLECHIKRYYGDSFYQFQYLQPASGWGHMSLEKLERKCKVTYVFGTILWV